MLLLHALVLMRLYMGSPDPWFPPSVENLSHCDFVKLRTMLVRTHMQDLKDVTRETHYENYRTQCIQSMTRMVVKERNRKYGPGSSAGHEVWAVGHASCPSVLPFGALKPLQNWAVLPLSPK